MELSETSFKENKDLWTQTLEFLLSLQNLEATLAPAMAARDHAIQKLELVKRGHYWDTISGSEKEMRIFKTPEAKLFVNWDKAPEGANAVLKNSFIHFSNGEPNDPRAWRKFDYENNKAYYQTNGKWSEYVFCLEQIQELILKPA